MMVQGRTDKPMTQLDEAVTDAAARPAPPANTARTFTSNAMLSIARLLLSTAVGFVLPSFLVHHLPVTTYAAWVLILQMSAYVGYLDFGIQTGIAKYVAEFDARGDAEGAGHRASAGMAMLLLVSAVGCVLTVVLAWQVPRIFHDMPPGLYHDVRIGLIWVGISTCVNLFCGIFNAIFTGLQRFAVPTVLSLVNRVLFVAVVLTAVALHGSLAAMGLAVAAVNVLTGLLNFVAWKRWAGSVRLRLAGLDYAAVRTMIGYCSTLAVWTVGMLCVSGLDLTIVGRWDYGQTGFYSIGTAPTNFMIAIMGAAMAPLMPAASALSVHRTPEGMGQVLARITRYSSTLLLVSGLPLMVGGYWLLRVWVGATYAFHVLPYLRILVLANVVRNLCAPYASMVVGTGSQRFAMATSLGEALVNLSASVYLVRHIGAIGVAYGTLLGSFVSVGMHFAVSMHYTRTQFAIGRLRLFGAGIGRPLLVAAPSLLLVTRWWVPGAPAMGAGLWSLWLLSSVAVVWLAALSAGERLSLLGVLRTRVRKARFAAAGAR
jgi:O-antigen/teichoic acid export membrane protein